MMTDEFEMAFGAFLDSEDCDRMQEKQQENLFVIARTAFAAGWHAAQKAAAVGGQPEKD